VSWYLAGLGAIVLLSLVAAGVALTELQQLRDRVSKLEATLCQRTRSRAIIVGEHEEKGEG